MEVPVFVGHDYRLSLNSLVCRHSLESRGPVKVHLLKHDELRRKGVFTRPWLVDSQGLLWDQRDGLPFSTEFSHSRFLVPHLAREMGYERAIFVDGDFVFLRNVHELLEEATAPVCVVKHDYAPQTDTKMAGQLQTRYARKLWTSLMVFDLTKFKGLTREEANTKSGAWLHSMEWAPDIGALDPAWNFIPGHNTGKPKAVHYTLGTPVHPEHRGGPMAGVWIEEYQDMQRTQCL